MEINKSKAKDWSGLLEGGAFQIDPCTKEEFLQFSKNMDKLEAIKFDKEKPKMSYIPQLALLEVGKTFTYGASKYKEFNYSLGMEYTRYIDAALRHINQALRGEDIDEESQCFHLANGIASLMMCLDNQLSGTVKDNRNKIYKDGIKTEQ